MSPETKRTTEALARIRESASDKTALNQARKSLANSRVGVARIDKAIRASRGHES
jgi:hypothetical protein